MIKIKARLTLADMRIGFHWNSKTKALWIHPLPCVAICVFREAGPKPIPDFGCQTMGLPKGYKLIAYGHSCSVYTDGDRVVIEGDPPPEEYGDTLHDCDAMGCRQGHVIGIGEIGWDNDLYRMRQIAGVASEHKRDFA